MRIVSLAIDACSPQIRNIILSITESATCTYYAVSEDFHINMRPVQKQ